MGIYLAMSIASIVITSICLDKMPLSWLPDYDIHKPLRQKIKESITATIRLIPNTDMLLLLPITICAAVQSSFFAADFSKVGQG